MKRKRGEKIAKPTRAQIEKWDKILESQGLGMGRGRRNWLTYAGSGNDIGALDGVIRQNTGKVKEP